MRSFSRTSDGPRTAASCMCLGVEPDLLLATSRILTSDICVPTCRKKSKPPPLVNLLPKSRMTFSWKHSPLLRRKLRLMQTKTRTLATINGRLWVVFRAPRSIISPFRHRPCSGSQSGQLEKPRNSRHNPYANCLRKQ